MAPKPRLNEQHVERVRELLTSHLAADVAAMLDVNTATLRKFMRRHNIPPRSAQVFYASDDLVSAYQAGETIEKLAKLAEVDRATLRNALVRRGVDIRKNWSRTRGRLPTYRAGRGPNGRAASKRQEAS